MTTPSRRSPPDNRPKSAPDAAHRDAKKPEAARRRPDLRPKEDEELPPPDIHPVFFRPRGMHDVLPADQPYWDVVSETVRNLATSFNFHRIDPPIAEAPGLFERAMGATSDVVEKELFFVRDRSGRERLVLRPEFTAGLVRAYLEHGMHTLPQPVRLWYVGPVFRHDRPQAGRYRQFAQFGFEVFGEGSPLIDAQVIHLAHEVYRGFQLEQVRMEVNSLGHPAADCRLGYLEQLKHHAQANLPKLCANCRRRAKRQPLRILDCKEEKCQVVANQAPKLLEHLCTPCLSHYRELWALLTDLDIPVKENQRLVRGLDYYTRTVFEVVPTTPVGETPAAGAAPEVPAAPPGGGATPVTTALGGGGRYDGLIELFGGAPTPAMGFSGGVERAILAMKAEGVEAVVLARPELFLVHLGELGRKRALKLFDDLRRSGFRVAEAFHKAGIKAQLRAADRQKIPWALILGQKEALDNSVIIRNMESGVQETIDLNLDVLVPALKKRLRREE